MVASRVNRPERIQPQPQAGRAGTVPPDTFAAAAARPTAQTDDAKRKAHVGYWADLITGDDFPSDVSART